jgi:hypothetical protein
MITWSWSNLQLGGSFISSNDEPIEHPPPAICRGGCEQKKTANDPLEQLQDPVMPISLWIWFAIVGGILWGIVTVSVGR